VPRRGKHPLSTCHAQRFQLFLNHIKRTIHSQNYCVNDDRTIGMKRIRQRLTTLEVVRTHWIAVTTVTFAQCSSEQECIKPNSINLSLSRLSRVKTDHMQNQLLHMESAVIYKHRMKMNIRILLQRYI
jgi:hypothetical protein